MKPSAWFALACYIIAMIGLMAIAARQPDVPAAVIREVVRAESVFVTDTVRLRAVLTRWDTIRTRDTIVVDSIVYVPRTIVDSIVAACRPLPTSCQSLVAAVRDSGSTPFLALRTAASTSGSPLSIRALTILSSAMSTWSVE